MLIIVATVLRKVTSFRLFTVIILSFIQHCTGVSPVPLRHSCIVLTRTDIVNCSLSFPTRTSVFFKNASDLTVSVGRPSAGFESVSFPCFFGICFPVRKLTLHAWWYTASAACRSCANSYLPRTVSTHSSFLTLQTCCILSSKSFVRTGITS